MALTLRHGSTEEIFLIKKSPNHRSGDLTQENKEYLAI
jgi:hypothetical protein